MDTQYSHTMRLPKFDSKNLGIIIGPNRTDCEEKTFLAKKPSLRKNVLTKAWTSFSLYKEKENIEGESFLQPKENTEGESFLQPKETPEGKSFLRPKEDSEGKSFLRAEGIPEGKLHSRRKIPKGKLSFANEKSPFTKENVRNIFLREGKRSLGIPSRREISNSFPSPKESVSLARDSVSFAGRRRNRMPPLLSKDGGISVKRPRENGENAFQKVYIRVSQSKLYF